MATFTTDTIRAKLEAAYARVGAHTYDMLELDWWPAIGGTGDMPPPGSYYLDAAVLYQLAIGGQSVAGSPQERWARYWEWVTLTPAEVPTPEEIVHWFTGGTQNRSPMGTTFADIDDFVAQGNEWVRIPIDMAYVLANCDPADPTLAGIDLGPNGIGNTIVYAYAQGLNVMVTLTYGPAAWGQQYHEIPKGATNILGWARGAAALLDHYGVTVQAWEIWNEINHGPFNYAPTMATIRPFMKQVALTMRATDPDCFLVTSGGASASTYTAEWDARWDTGNAAVTATGATYAEGNGGGSISSATYMWNMFGADGIVAGNTVGTAWYNAYGIHGYCGVYSPLLVHRGIQTYHAFNDVPGQGTSDYNYWDDIIVAKEGGTTKPIWQTEGGFHGGSVAPATVFTEGEAANALLVFCAYWSPYQLLGFAGPSFNFENKDQEIYGASANTEDYLGMNAKTATGYVPKAQLDTWEWACQYMVTA